MKISFVIPCHNEEKNIRLVHKEIIQHISKFNHEVEFIFVDDGSVDTTWQMITNLSHEFPEVKGIQLSRNYGHAIALEAGLLEAKGDAVVMMDGDLQHPPSLIPEMITAWENGSKIVQTVRNSTQGESKFKQFTSLHFYKMINRLSDIDIKSGEADFRLVDRTPLNLVLSMPESPKFFRGLFNWIGFEKYEVHYKAPLRLNGKSSFTFSKMFDLARIGLTSFSKKPLVFIFFIGFFLSLISAVLLLGMAITKIFISPLFFSNLSFIVIFILLITGLILTSQGILATYVIDIFDSAKARPNFIRKQSINIEK